MRVIRGEGGNLPPGTRDYVTCSCGSAWFILRDHSDGEPIPGAVAVDASGVVIARVGNLVCDGCGRVYQRAPTRDFRSVES